MIEQIKQLIVIGDSSVYGWGDPEGGGWCERLRQKWMNESGRPAIYQLGIRGDGLEKVAKRWKQEWEARGELRRKVPDGILLNIGINDTAKVGRIDGRPQISPQGFSFGLERLLSEMKKNTTVFVMGLTPVNEQAMPFAQCLWYSNNSCNHYERLIEETCLEQDIPFLPTHRLITQEKNWSSLITTDGIHLNTQGHICIYKKLIAWKTLLDWA